MRVAYFSEDDVRELLSYQQLVPAMAQALVQFSTGQVIQPVRQMLPVEAEQRYLGIMPAVTPSAMGAKLVCFYPKNAGTDHHTHQASIALLDPAFGTPLAFMDGRLITEMRTAATSAAVTQRVANPDSKILALIGSGVQAEAHLEALSTLYDFDEIRIWSRTTANAERFAQQHGAVAMEARAAVEGADIVVTATNAREPVLQGAWLKPGAHVNAVGSPRPNWRELDDAAMSNTIIVDSREAAAVEAGDVILSGAEISAEAGEVLAGTVSVGSGATTVFKSLGMAVEDIVAARLVYANHIQKQDGKA